MDKEQTKFLDTLLARRDAHIVKKMQEQVSDLNYEIQAMEQEVKRMKEARNKWSKALREEKFWELKGVLLHQKISKIKLIGINNMQYDYIDCFECGEETKIQMEQGEFGLEPLEFKEKCEHCGEAFPDCGIDEGLAERRQMGLTSL